MDIWKYYDITHKKHSDLNPMSKDKLDKLFLLLDLMPNSRVLDIGCGKGESLIRLVDLFNISGVGVDLSPYHSKDCKENINKRVPSSDIKILEMDGAKYKPDVNEIYNLSMCLGASWIYNGFKGTVKALKKMTKPEGLIIVGEPYWLKEPDGEYLKMSGINALPCVKKGGSVLSGIQDLLGYKMIVCGHSPNLVTELNNYEWIDRGSKTIPVDDHNHLIDPIRYAKFKLSNSFFVL